MDFALLAFLCTHESMREMNKHNFVSFFFFRWYLTTPNYNYMSAIRHGQGKSNPTDLKQQQQIPLCSLDLKGMWRKLEYY